METDNPCPVCLKQAGGVDVDFKNDIAAVACPRCGRFEITDSARMGSDARTGGGRERPRLSAALRAASDQGVVIRVTTYNIEDLIDSVHYPRTLMEGIDRVLEVVNARSDSPTAAVRFNADTDYRLIVAPDPVSAKEYLRKARELRLLEPQEGEGVRLDVAGWKRLERTTRERRRSDHAFVAMWFSPDLNEAWERGIKKALIELGWTPVRVDLIEHNEMIDGRIIAEIGRGGLLVADFTGQRHGVYFEAGLAMGLGIPVVRSCREDDPPSLHFDTRQYSHVVWTTPEDRCARLKARLEATVPGRL